jgi:perosamine synthetase
MGKEKLINVFKPTMGKEELEVLEDIFASGWIGLGPKTREFEEKFAAFCKIKFAVGVNSATAALDLAMKLLGVNYGDEVIVPTMTFVSTAHVVAYNLAKPIFVDVDPETLNIDMEDVKRKLTPGTKAIIPVHYSGRPVDMDLLNKVVGNPGKVHIVEDCAHAAGSKYKGQPVGNFSDIGCFSFHAVKNLAMGDGGALVLNNEEWYERAKRLRWLGIDKSTWSRSENNKSYWWEYAVDEIGLKCHMNDISASIGLVQLKKLGAMNKRRVEIKNLYNQGFKDLARVRTPLDDDEDYQSSWHIYCLKCEQRDDLSFYLQQKKISTGVHYKPIHLYRCYGNRPTLPNAEKVFKQILTLPMYPDLTDSDVERVIAEIHNFYNGRR